MASVAEIDGFSIHYDGHSVVTVRQQNVSESQFGDRVAAAYTVASSFPRSKVGNIWGCDGVGYHAQQCIGVVEVHNSGVGPRKFAAHVRELLSGKAVA